MSLDSKMDDWKADAIFKRKSYGRKSVLFGMLEGAAIGWITGNVIFNEGIGSKKSIKILATGILAAVLISLGQSAAYCEGLFEMEKLSLDAITEITDFINSMVDDDSTDELRKAYLEEHGYD